MTDEPRPAAPMRLLLLLVFGFALGGLAGWGLTQPALADIRDPAVRLSGALGSCFLWLLTFFIHPLVAASVWVAVSKNSKSIGIALVAVLFFGITTAVALFWGSLAGFVFAPGEGLSFAVAGEAIGATPSTFDTVIEFIKEPFPSLWKQMGLLELIAFMAVKALIFVPLFPKPTQHLNKMFEIMQDLCMGWMQKILKVLPIALFFMAMSLVGEKGIGFLATKVGTLLVADAAALLMHQVTLAIVLFFMVGPRITRFIRTMAPAYLTALASRSSMGTLPTTMRCAHKFGIPEKISNFIFPFGATVNMDGTCAHIMICLMVMLQSINEPISVGMIATIGLTVMAASVATAAAPSASISLMGVVATTALKGQGVEISDAEIAKAIALFASIDFFSDALRTQTNLYGDSMASLFLTRIFGSKDEANMDSSG